MTCRQVVVALLVTLHACAIPTVQVDPLHPTPRPLWPHGVDTLQIYTTRPEGGIAVYTLEAVGENEADVEIALKEKAAGLGCDGVMFTVRAGQSKSMAADLTGKLNQHRGFVDAHIDALCVVVPLAPGACPVGARPDPAVVAAEVDRAARDTLEQWRRAHESGNSDALASLYVHDASLSVVRDGTMILGWTAFAPVLRDEVAAAAIRVRVGDVQVGAVGGTAVVVATVVRERRDGSAVTEDGVVTLVLRPGSEAGWRIAAEHASYRRR